MELARQGIIKDSKDIRDTIKDTFGKSQHVGTMVERNTTNTDDAFSLAVRVTRRRKVYLIKLCSANIL